MWDQHGPGVLQLPVASSFRRKLSSAEYNKLLTAVRRARANKQPYWNVFTNNCNHFVGELAQALGMRLPSDFQVSYTFIPALRDLNQSALQTKPASKGMAPPSDQTPARSAKTPLS